MKASSGAACTPPEPARVKPLNLTSFCEDDTSKRYWRISNPNAFAVEVTYQVIGDESQTTTLTATASENTFFTTQDVGGANTVKITWKNELGESKSKVKASSNQRCSCQLAYELVPVGPSCSDAAGGKITLNITGGSGQYAYLWNTGATTASLENLGSGTYSVTVTDKGSQAACVIQKEVSIEATGLLVELSLEALPSCATASDGKLSSQVSGGSAPYSYAWSGGGSQASLSEVSSGNYTLTVEDAAGCKGEASIRVEAPGQACEDALSLSFRTKPVSCQEEADGEVVLDILGGSGSYRYAWSTGATTKNLNQVSAGTYTVTVTDAGDASLSQTGSVTVSKVTAPSVNIQASASALCGGGSVTLSAQGAETYLWYPGGETTSQIQVSSPGSYYVVGSKDGYRVTSESIAIAYQPSSVQIIASKDAVCQGEAVTLTSSAAQGNVWSTGETSRSITVSEAGTYSVTLRTVGCEALTASKTIAEKSAADCEAPQRDPMCEPVIFPTVPNNEPCNQYSADLLIANARMKYQAYLKTKRKEFELAYLGHCLDVKEDFTMQYEDQEHHYTLYYYDQAGNLSRTVPPEGVKLLAPDALSQVREDRQAQQERVFTKHELATTYSYNSLNQLISQDMPDHGQLELKQLEAINQDVPANLSITSSEFTSAQQGYLIAHDGNESHFYTTDDAGKSWSSLSKIGTEDLEDVQMLAGSNIGYAVGQAGTLLKSEDGGSSWQLQPVPTLGKLVAVLFFSEREGLVFEEDGRMWYTEDGAESEAWQQDQALANVLRGRLTGISSSGDVLLASSEDNGRGYVYRSLDVGLSWQQVNKFKSSELLALSFYNSNSGYAAGEDGRLLKSVNQGQTWQIIETSTNKDFKQLQFSTGSEGYALSKDGDLLSTSNGGSSWTAMNAPATGLAAMYWQDSRGYVGKGNQLWTSSNSGTSWQAVSTTGMSGSIIGLHAEGNKRQVLLSNGSIYESSNSGNSSWTLLDSRGLSAWSWVSASTVYGLDSQGNVWKSSNGASSWQKINSVSSGLQTIHFVSNQQGYLAGEGGKLYRSSDGGSSWQAVSEQVQPLGLADISLESSTAYAVGKSGTVWKSVDAGQSFVQLKSQTKADLNSVAARGQQVSIGGQAGSVLTSSNGGSSWTVSKNAEQLALLSVAYNSSNQAYLSGEDCSITDNTGSLKTTVTPPDDLLAISFSGNTGVAVGEKGKIIRSSDGGNSWQMVSEVKAPVLQASQQVDSEVGYAVGEQGAILKTEDAGAHWQAVATGKVADLYGVHFSSASMGVVVGAQGMMLRTTDGKSFSQVNTGTSQTLRDVHSSAGLWLAVGDGGVILSSSNGSSWQSRSSGTAANLKAVYVIDETTAYAVGEQGTILRGTNQGKNWQQLKQTNGNAWTSANLNDVYFKDYVTGYVIGTSGTILKTVTRGQSWEAETGDAGNTELLSITPQPHNPNTVAITGAQGTVVSYQDETDLYGSRFFYDKLGRLVISQNAKQFNQAIPAYSYTEYDALGRITEVGEVATGEAVNDLKDNNGQIDQKKLAKWVEVGSRTEITRTYYDTVVYAVAGLEQEHLRNRVSSTTYQQAEGEDYDYATHYSYDIHGNVSTLIQDNPALAAIEQQYKRVDYDYDLISGNVHEVTYQPGEKDQFFHRYAYDADNRIVEVQTSSDGVIWDRDAGYEYYEHGPLARMELGEQQVQGLDYAYTIQGWLKGVNSTSLDAEKDMGQDGLAGSINSAVAKDEFGYSLSYFDGDYSAVNAPKSDLDVQVGNNLYNGNIRNMTTSIRKFMQGGTTQTMAYQYDQLNRIKESQAYDNQDGQLTAKEDYKTKYSYDANGNLLSLHRNATTAEGRKLMMDELEYVYETKENGYERNTNKLRQVRDAVASGNYSDDIDSQGKDNYAYDEIGNLIEDKQEGITKIDWTVYGKVQKVSKQDGSFTEFRYDAAGNRIAKRFKKPGGRSNHPLRARCQWEHDGDLRTKWRLV